MVIFWKICCSVWLNAISRKNYLILGHDFTNAIFKFSWILLSTYTLKHPVSQSLFTMSYSPHDFAFNVFYLSATHQKVSTPGFEIIFWTTQQNHRTKKCGILGYFCLESRDCYLYILRCYQLRDDILYNCESIYSCDEDQRLTITFFPSLHVTTWVLQCWPGSRNAEFKSVFECLKRSSRRTMMRPHGLRIQHCQHSIDIIP